MSADVEKPERPFDPFELLTAILLGLAAIGAAVAGFQAGQWGGKQLEAFSEANTLTTKASTQYNEDTVLMNADYAAIAKAKEHLIEAREAKSAAERDKHLELASYFYTTQLSQNAYTTMKLPAGLFVEDEDDKPAAAAGTAAPAAAAPTTTVPAAPAGADDEADEEETAAPAAGPGGLTEDGDIPDATLMASLDEELDEAYTTQMLEEGTAMFASADKKFADGRQANENGDKFDLTGVLFTVALFFAGLGLVFKTSIRWGFFGAGALVFLGSLGYMATLPWA